MAVFALGAAFLASFMVSRFSTVVQFGSDCHIKDKPQRLHQHKVSRLGGIGILAGIGVFALLSLPTASGSGLVHEPFPVWIVFVGLPVFALGIIEDFSGKVSPRLRLSAAFVSALMAGILLKAVLPIPWISTGGLGVLCWIFTCFCVAGVTHSFNIIDGLNGLSSGVAVIVLSGLGWIAHGLGDMLLVQLSVGTIASILGFMLVNYPKGRIFLGDGGAYLLGFLIAVMSVLLLVRHSELTWFLPLSLAIYPVIETLYSIYRRKIKSTGAQKADALHLHSLVHKRLNRWAWGSVSNGMLRNSLSTTFFWVWQGISLMIVLTIWDQKSLLILYCALSVLFYLGMYRMLVRFKAPKWMKIISRPQAVQQELDFPDLVKELYSKEKPYLNDKGQPISDQDNPNEVAAEKASPQQLFLEDRN